MHHIEGQQIKYVIGAERGLKETGQKRVRAQKF